MSVFPSAIYSPRTIENRPGVVYDADDTKTFFAEDHEQVTGEVVAIENALGANLANLGLNGWLSIATIPTLQASDNPVYTLRFASDMTAIIGLGNRIKLTQHGSVKYFIVVKVGSYTGGNTDIDVYGGTDYDMEDTSTYPVTLPYYSIQKAPFGFPLNPVKWTEKVTDTSQRLKTSPTNDTWYYSGVGSINISVPIGAWNLRYYVIGQVRKTTSDISVILALSTSNNSISDAELEASGYGYQYCVQSIFRSKNIILTTKATYYLIVQTGTASVTNVGFRNDLATCVIEAVCAYL